MITVKDLMSHELYTLKPTDTVRQAQRLMLDKKIRHIPIVDEQGEFVGLLTKRDVLAASVSALADLSSTERDELEAGIPIAKIMITQVIAAEESTPLGDAARFMLDQKHGCLPVFRNGKLLGILTESDFVRLSIRLLDQLEQDKKVE
jgi:CBS domain-containing protein